MSDDNLCDVGDGVKLRSSDVRCLAILMTFLRMRTSGAGSLAAFGHEELNATVVWLRDIARGLRGIAWRIEQGVAHARATARFAAGAQKESGECSAKPTKSQ